MALDDFLERADMPQDASDISAEHQDALELSGTNGTDYVLREGHNSCWVTVNNISVYIVNDGAGVEVTLYPVGQEAEAELDQASARFADAIPDNTEAGYDDELPGHPNAMY